MCMLTGMAGQSGHGDGYYTGDSGRLPLPGYGHRVSGRGCPPCGQLQEQRRIPLPDASVRSLCRRCTRPLPPYALFPNLFIVVVEWRMSLIHPLLAEQGAHTVGCAAKCETCVLTPQANYMQVQCGHAEADPARFDVHGHARSPSEARRRAVYMAVQFQVHYRASLRIGLRRNLSLWPG